MTSTSREARPPPGEAPPAAWLLSHPDDQPADVCPVASDVLRGLYLAVAAGIARPDDPAWLAPGGPGGPGVRGSRSTPEGTRARASWLARRASERWAPLAAALAVSRLEAEWVDCAGARAAMARHLREPSEATSLAAEGQFDALERELNSRVTLTTGIFDRARFGAWSSWARGASLALGHARKAARCDAEGSRAGWVTYFAAHSILAAVDVSGDRFGATREALADVALLLRVGCAP